MSENEKLPDDILWHQSGVNSEGHPFVQLIRGTEVIAQMDVQDAREHAQAMIEAAEAAETDAFIYQWVMQFLSGDKLQGARLIADFRRYRTEITGKRHGPTSPRDWVMPSDKP